MPRRCRCNVQVVSTKPSTPRFGFGSSNRDHQAKVYISAEHEKTTPGGLGAPGPGQYPIGGTTGKQVRSNERTASSWGFGTSARFRATAKQAGTPGPGAYVV